MTKTVNIGIVGVGYWGPNYARLCFEVEGVNLKWFADLDKNALAKVKQRYPSVDTTTDYQDLLKDKSLQAVVVTTPAQTHFQIVKDFLLAGKNVLVEKPLTASSRQAIELIKLQKKTKKILMVDHTFLFNPAVKKLKEYIGSGELGKIDYFVASYSALGPIRKDVDVLWDLGPHWIYTVSYLLDKKPLEVQASGGEFLKDKMKDVVFLNLKYPGNIIANIHVSWIYPKKERYLTVVGDKKMAIFDDVSVDSKLVIFDRGVTINSVDPNFANLQVVVRDGDIIVPKIENKEPLKESFKHFLSSIKEEKKPFSDVQEGARVVNIMEKANLSMKKGGAPVEL